MVHLGHSGVSCSCLISLPYISMALCIYIVTITPEEKAGLNVMQSQEMFWPIPGLLIQLCRGDREMGTAINVYK